jgi:hypothetical protein
MVTATKITITCAADESARKFTVTGKDAYGRQIVEKITGVSGTAATSGLYYTEVSRIEIDGATTGNVSAGVSGDADAILTVATLSAAAAFTLNGIFTYESTMRGIADNHAPVAIKITSAGDDSGITFTVYGQDGNYDDCTEVITGANAGVASGTTTFQKVYAIYASGAAAGAVYAGWPNDLDGIAASQSVSGGAGYLVMNGAYCDPQPRHISITSASDDESGKTFTITGTDWRDEALTETLAGPGAGLTVNGDKNFKTVRAVYCSAALAGNVTVGSADECESQPIVIDHRYNESTVAIDHSADSDLNHRFLYTMDDLLAGPRYENNARWHVKTEEKGASELIADLEACKAVRLEVAGHVRGVVDLTLTFPTGY